MTGSTIAGRYVLTGLLGRGGFGVVYSGRDIVAGGEVAVKVFSRSEGFASRAQREARTAGKLEHPNIHSCLGVEQDEGHAYLISRLVVGERFDRAGLGDEEAVRAIAAVADALAHAHTRGVVHRDVKPSNILVSTDGDVTLTDFGIARDEDARDQTLDERVLGTLSYMAPEQAAGEQASGATDVWAAALTLYEALTGSNPFRTKSLSDLLERLAAGAEPLSRLRPDLPKPLSRTLERALHRDPERRPSPEELRDQLLASLRPDVVDAGPAPALAGSRLTRLAGRAGAPLVLALTALITLVTFPMYPGSWLIPIAVLAAAIAWRSPLAASAGLAALCLPAFWNYAQAAALVYVPLVILWLCCGRKWGARMLAPLWAAPLAMMGAGPAFVLVAATAPTPRRRAAEGIAGGLVATVMASLAPRAAVAHLPSAPDPTIYLTVLPRMPAVIAVVAAVAAFAVLLPLAWNHDGPRRMQALTLWGLGFALATVALPYLIQTHAVSVEQAGSAALAVGIIPPVWALAAPRLLPSR